MPERLEFRLQIVAAARSLPEELRRRFTRTAADMLRDLDQPDEFDVAQATAMARERVACGPPALIDLRGQRGAAATSFSRVTPSHSITSSARASSVGGTSRPSALAVFRLMTNSYLVGACTGRSAGFPP
jgi:hypothetical protein